MNRTLVIIGSLLLVAAVLPGVAAHLTADGGSATSFGFGGPTNADPCRYMSTDDDETDADCTDAQHPGVSGTYVINPEGNDFIGIGDPDGDEEPGITVVELSEVPELPYWDQDDDGDWNEPGDYADDPDTMEVAPTLFPAGSSSSAGALCDAEVIDAAGIADEEVVDGDDDVGGAQPDGTWDDGGFGGACHTPETHYNDQEWNTAGCGEGTDSGKSHAEDWTAGDYVFITANCNFQIEENAGNRAVILVVDYINDVLGSPTDPMQTIEEAQESTDEFVEDVQNNECATTVGSGPFVGCFVNFLSGSGELNVRCEVDSAADDAVNGFGGGNAGGATNLPAPQAPPNQADLAGDGVPYPGVSGQCADDVENAQAVATTFVYHSTAFTEGVWEGGNTIQPVGVYQSTGGWIDSECVDDPNTPNIDECAE